jgi:hypothetical protein
MKKWGSFVTAALLVTAPAAAERGAQFDGWNVQTHAALIGKDGSLYELASPNAAPRALLSENGIAAAGWAPRKGDVLVVEKSGQLYSATDRRLTLLTDGKSRNRPNTWSHDGHWLVYISKRRNGADEDIYVVDPRDPKSDRLAAQVSGAGWAVLDFTADGTSAVVAHRLPSAKTALFFMDVASGAMRPIGKPGAYGDVRFSYDGVLWAVSTGRLGMIDAGSGIFTPVAPDMRGVDRLEVSLDGKLVAYVTGGALKLLDTRTGQARAVPGLPAGPIDDLHFAPWGVLGFSAAGKVYALDTATMEVTPWTT